MYRSAFADRQLTFLTAGIVHVPLMIEGSFSFGQYIRSIRMNLSAGAGSQFDSLSAPGESSIDPSGFDAGLLVVVVGD
jgi:hypothetical protein